MKKTIAARHIADNYGLFDGGVSEVAVSSVPEGIRKEFNGVSQAGEYCRRIFPDPVCDDFRITGTVDPKGSADSELFGITTCKDMTAGFAAGNGVMIAECELKEGDRVAVTCIDGDWDVRIEGKTQQPVKVKVGKSKRRTISVNTVRDLPKVR